MPVAWPLAQNSAVPPVESARCLGRQCRSSGSPFPVALDLLVAAAGQLPGDVCPGHHLVPGARPLYEDSQLLVLILRPRDAPLHIWVDLQESTAYRAGAHWPA